MHRPPSGPSDAATGAAREAAKPAPAPQGAATADRAPLAGFLAALGASCVWGVAPVFFTLLNDVPRDELLAHRAVWACLFVLVYCVATGRLARVAATLRDRRVMAGLALSAFLMSSNWFIFLIAVAAGRVFDAGLGYYMMPLMSVALAVAVLGERLSRLQWAAIALAALAVGILSYGLGAAPWLPLAIGGSFALYGLARKRIDVGSIVGFQAEALVLAPVGLVWLAMAHGLGWQFMGGTYGLFGVDLATSLLLMASGIVTGLPLILFAEAARRLRYATLGLMQYLNPTIQVAAAGLILGEVFTRWHWWALALIWCALALYGRELVRQGRARRSAAIISSTVSTTVR